MVSPAKKRFEQIRAAKLAAAAKAQEREAETVKAEAEQKPRPNPYNRQAGKKSASSPARKHFEQARAKAQAAQATPDRPHGDAYEITLAALIEDSRRLHDIQSIERKIDAKMELLPNYEAYVKGVLEGGTGQDDEVLMTLMVWYLDVGDLETALDIAEYAAEHGLNTPDKYQRSTAALVSEEVAEFALKMELGTDEDELVRAQVTRALELFGLSDMHDQVKAKLFKAQGYLLRSLGKTELAIPALERALELNDKVGVKKDIESLKKELKNSGQ